MSYSHSNMVLIQEKVADLFQIVQDLEETFVGRKFTLDGHLVGSIGEVLASYHYGVELLPNSYKTHDAKTDEGKYIQIKTTQRKGILLSSEPEYLIVLWLDRKTGNVCEVYNGPGNLAWEASGAVGKNEGRPLPFTKLRVLSTQVREVKKIKIINPIPNYFQNTSVETFTTMANATIEKGETIQPRSNRKSTEVGYINKNNQVNKGKTEEKGTGFGQYFYQMECLNCNTLYKANGHDIWLRKCPTCQNGRK